MPLQTVDDIRQLQTGELTPEAFARLQRHFSLDTVGGKPHFIDNRTDIQVDDSVDRVYPHKDEAEDLLALAQSLGMKFERVYDCFCGDGKAGLQMIYKRVAERLYAIDLNSRAIDLAVSNRKLNGIPESKACFVPDSVFNLGDEVLQSSGPTLYIANPPFALNEEEKEGRQRDLMRDGGFNGLNLTKGYIDQTLAKTHIERAAHAAKVGDVIIGVAYSRISENGDVELEDTLREVTPGHGRYELNLLSHRKLWRGGNKKKEQDNPMALDKMRVKAMDGERVINEQEAADYDAFAQRHKEEGYDRLGYFSYVIRIGEIDPNRDRARMNFGQLLDGSQRATSSLYGESFDEM